MNNYQHGWKRSQYIKPHDVSESVRHAMEQGGVIALDEDCPEPVLEREYITSESVDPVTAYHLRVQKNIIDLFNK